MPHPLSNDLRRGVVAFAAVRYPGLTADHVAGSNTDKGEVETQISQSGLADDESDHVDQRISAGIILFQRLRRAGDDRMGVGFSR